MLRRDHLRRRLAPLDRADIAALEEPAGATIDNVELFVDAGLDGGGDHLVLWRAATLQQVGVLGGVLGDSQFRIAFVS